MNAKKKVLIVGGGAAGLTAAIIAARNGAEVTILEQMNRVGKKILATGNGRCNLTNIGMDIERFHGLNPKFAIGILNQFSVDETIQFFEELGVSCKTEDGGKVFPYSGQAASVLDVLRYEVEQQGVVERTEAGVKSIQRQKNGFTLTLRDGESLACDTVIVATGGKASPNLGSNGSGYNLVVPFGHKLIEPFPALVQLRLEAGFLKAIQGVRFEGVGTVGVGDKVLRKEYGEILFTDYGISGPAIFQLSRTAGEQLQLGKRPWIEVDLFPEFSAEELQTMLQIKFGYQPKKPLDFSFIGFLNKRLIPVVLKEAGVEDLKKSCVQLTGKELKNLLGILKNWKMEISGTQSWTEAQVTAGGIDVKDINPRTMESKLMPGLYFAGEIVDIDGDCGGFNLQWAWSSGYVAGVNAAK